MQTIAASQYSSIPHADPEDHTSVAPDGDGTHCSGLGAEQFEKLLNKQLNGSRSALKVVSQSFRSIPVYPHQFSEHQRRVRQNYNDMSAATRNSDLRGDSNALLVLFDPLDSVTMSVAESSQSPDLQLPSHIDRDIHSDQTPPHAPPSDVSVYVPHPSFCALFHSAGVLPAVQVPFCTPVGDVGHGTDPSSCWSSLSYCWSC